MEVEMEVETDVNHESRRKNGSIMCNNPFENILYPATNIVCR